MSLTAAQQKKLTDQIAAAHPRWAPKAWQEKALWFDRELSQPLQPLLVDWLETGAQREYDAGEFSIRRIMGLRQVDYLTALEWMDLYLKDPRKGRNTILPF